jgi:hypothetical protein
VRAQSVKYTFIRVNRVSGANISAAQDFQCVIAHVAMPSVSNLNAEAMQTEDRLSEWGCGAIGSAPG